GPPKHHGLPLSAAPPDRPLSERPGDEPERCPLLLRQGSAFYGVLDAGERLSRAHHPLDFPAVTIERRCRCACHRGSLLCWSAKSASHGLGPASGGSADYC